ncbi:MAG TPA: peptidylprolyl isomerase, partial [Saprospiraceae bacterium]|nr:peptidylprolyl isomerase [Saprospiraceae bacterium]
KNGWILIVLMALALGGFILMEIMGNLNRNSQGDVNTLARVNGKDIKYSNFENYQNIIYGNAQQDPYQVRNDVWDYFLENALVKDEADKMGLGIGRDELQDLQFGTNLSPVIVQRFSDPNTRQVQRAALQNVKTMMDEGRFTDERNRVYWKTMVEEVIKDRLQSKVVNVVSKGMYTPTWQAEMVFRENNERVDFRYVRIGYEKVSDEESKVTDEDYTNYLKENPNLFSQTEETRVLDYAALDVVPSSSDSAAAREVVAKLVDGFRTAANDSNYVALNSGVYETVYKPKNLLSPVAADTLLRLPVGSVVGPYLDGDVWTVAKILGRKTLPDSVRARHILIQGAENPASAERTIDSLMALLNAKRVPFDTLARRNSQDGGSAVKGGDLGWFANGTMVPEFNDVCFVTGEQGKLYKVRTQFGWHIIDITGKKFVKNEPSVKAAYLRQRVEPSKATQQAVKDRAVALIQKSKTLSDLTKSVGQENLSIQSSFPLKANDYLVGSFAGNDARAMVKWAYEDGTDANDVSGEVFSIRDAGGGFFDTKYVVAGLKTITPAGKSDVAALKANPEADQKVKSRKKGEVIASKIQGQTDLGAIAGQWQTKVDTARNASFMQGGSEPRVVGTVFNTAKDAVSAPIIGSNGVYVVSPLTDKPQIQLPPDLTMFRRQLVSTAVSQVKIGLISSMKKTADVEDFRSKFY